MYCNKSQFPFYHDFELLAGLGAVRILKAESGNAFNQLTDFHNEIKDWLFGYFSYDLKNETEALHSAHPDRIGLPEMYFFQPEIVLLIEAKSRASASAMPVPTIIPKITA